MAIADEQTDDVIACAFLHGSDNGGSCSLGQSFLKIKPKLSFNPSSVTKVKRSDLTYLKANAIGYMGSGIRLHTTPGLRVRMHC